MPRLRRADPSRPGLARRRQGRGFSYRDEHGRSLRDAEVIERIRALGIPPAWREVWICSDPFGHLQATGIDAAGRKQYRYHDRWRESRDRRKFDDMLGFAAALPRVRRRVKRELRGTEPTRERVLAGAVRLLDLGFFRIGSDHSEPAQARDSFGLTTMLREHARIEHGQIIFDYVGKSGQHRVHAIADDDLLALVAQLKRRRGGPPELLAYREGRRWSGVGADTVNLHLKALTGGDFSAKDFRTWNATVLASVALAGEGVEPLRSRTATKRAISRSVKTVAAYLGNTPAVARSSYIDPRVFDRYTSGWTIAETISRLGGDPALGDERVRRRIETAVLDMLTEAEESRLASAA